MNSDDELFTASVNSFTPKTKQKSQTKRLKYRKSSSKKKSKSKYKTPKGKFSKSTKKTFEGWITNLKNNNFGLDQTLDPLKIP